jgi:hypothetical protein
MNKFYFTIYEARSKIREFSKILNKIKAKVLTKGGKGVIEWWIMVRSGKLW